ncbi:hypothetical protein ACWC4D_33875 [Streptomyces sp. NPDC001288]
MTTTLPTPRAYPRPPVAVRPADLFQEAVYEDGQPYNAGLDDEDDEDL